ncbi:MAG: hypothetical protein MJH10_10675 [Epibacterium sp.]|nr:hypothetical protein [Epibacterium sp.]NQX74005.1 hypothetical protein [Epibacterium sp.]
MKVILYIGHHKVGSTALQSYLSQSWLPLARAGVLYPSIDGEGFAANLASLLGKPIQDPDAIFIREPHSALAYRMIHEATPQLPIPPQFAGLPAAPQMLRSLRKQVEALAPHTLLLCSEAFANFGNIAKGQIAQLRDFCNSLADHVEFEIYCALRRPDAYLASWHGQRLKVGEPATSLATDWEAQYLHTVHFNYRLVIEEWMRQIPDARLHLRKYRDITKAGGSIKDFTSQTGLPLPDGLCPSLRANTSLPLASFPLMEQALQDLPGDQRHQLTKYLLTHGKALAPVANKDIELFGARQRAKLFKAFTPVERYLRSQTGQPEFFRDLETLTTPRPIPVESAGQDLVRALANRVSHSSFATPALADYIHKRAGAI